MKSFFIITCFLLLLPAASWGQISYTLPDTTSLADRTLRVIGEVKNVDEKMMVVKIQSVVAHRNASAWMRQGEELNIRLTGQGRPQVGSIIAADLKEKAEVGETPSSYLLLDYKTID
jgi:hypothetical protein